MPKIFPTIIRRITQIVGGGETNARVTQRIGLRFSNRLTALLATVKAGFGFSQGTTSLRISQKPAFTFAARVDSAEVVTTQKPAFRFSNTISKDAIVQKPAVNITQIVYSLSSVKGSNAVTESAVGGRTDWSTLTNAQGAPDNVFTSFLGSPIEARGGRLDLAYANYVDKTELTISAVTLAFDGWVDSTVLNNADVRLQYDIGAGVVTLETITGNADFNTTPKTFDITSAVGGDWSKLDALTTHVRAESALGENWRCFIDAVTVTVAASKTDTL